MTAAAASLEVTGAATVARQGEFKEIRRIKAAKAWPSRETVPGGMAFIKSFVSVPFGLIAVC
jgi:hypothetical protein